MNNRAFTISFLVAVGAVLMVYSYVTSTEETMRLKYGEDVPVVVAKKNIKELEILDETNLTTKSIPKEFKEPGTAEDIKSFTGGLAIAAINAGEQVTRTKITTLGARSGLARQVAIGKRAVTITVSDVQGVAKLIKPGDRVDVLAKLDPSGSGNPIMVEVRTILQDVLVLATGKYVTNTIPGIVEKDSFRGGEAGVRVPLSEYVTYPNITLEVDQYQAQRVVYASSVLGGVYLVLRNNDDNTKEEINKTSLSDFMGNDTPKVAPQNNAPPAVVPRR